MVIRQRRRTGKQKRRLLWFVSLLVLLVVFLECRLKPIAGSVSAIQAKALATEIINRSVFDVMQETGISCEELEHISYADGNMVTAISANTLLTNQLKNTVTLRIQEKLSDVRQHRVDIPLGTLIGSELTNGQGPSIPICISLSGNVRSDFESTFESGGLNQTVHKLSLRITAELHILMPLGAEETTVETSVLLGETVIVGEVPTGLLYSHAAGTGSASTSLLSPP